MGGTGLGTPAGLPTPGVPVEDVAGLPIAGVPVEDEALPPAGPTKSSGVGNFKAEARARTAADAAGFRRAPGGLVAPGVPAGLAAEVLDAAGAAGLPETCAPGEGVRAEGEPEGFAPACPPFWGGLGGGPDGMR